MSSNRRTASLVAAVMGAFLLAPIQPPISSAAVRATANPSTLSVSTGSMAIFAADTYTATNPFAALVTPANSGVAKVFYVKNTGSFGVSRFSMTVTLPANTTILNFRRCAINVNFIDKDICQSGSYTAVSISPSTATTIVLTLPAGSFYAFQIRQSRNNINMVINIAANSAFINTSGVTNS